MRGFTKNIEICAESYPQKGVHLFNRPHQDDPGSAGCRVERRIGSKKKLQQGDCFKSDL